MRLVDGSEIELYQTMQTRHEPLVKLKQSVNINSTNHGRSFTNPVLKPHTRLRMERSAFTIRLNYSAMSVVKSDEKPARNDSNHSQRPVFASYRKYEKLSFEPSQYECSDKHSIDCLNKTKEFRAKVLSEFGKSLVDSVDESSNIYNVEYEHPDDMMKYNPTCMVLDAKLRILTNKDSPFDTNKIGRLFPSRKLFGKKYMSAPRSCVIVSSAGSLYQSGLGKFIGKQFITIEVLVCSLRWMSHTHSLTGAADNLANRRVNHLVLFWNWILRFDYHRTVLFFLCVLFCFLFNCALSCPPNHDR